MLQCSVYQFEHHYTTARRAGARIGLHYSVQLLNTLRNCPTADINLKQNLSAQINISKL